MPSETQPIERKFRNLFGIFSFNCVCYSLHNIASRVEKYLVYLFYIYAYSINASCYATNENIILISREVFWDCAVVVKLKVWSLELSNIKWNERVKNRSKIFNRNYKFNNICYVKLFHIILFILILVNNVVTISTQPK